MKMSPAPHQPPADEPESNRSEAFPRWTFLSNHAHVLAVLHENPDVILREVAIEVGITERAVQRIIQELEEVGFIEREKVGRRNHYRVFLDKPLRHPLEAHCTIGELLNLIDQSRVTSREKTK